MTENRTNPKVIDFPVEETVSPKQRSAQQAEQELKALGLTGVKINADALHEDLDHPYYHPKSRLFGLSVIMHAIRRSRKNSR